MKKLLQLSTLLFLITGCTNVQKLIDRGDYDQAIHKLVSKMAGKKNKKHEDVLALEYAFQKAQDRDIRLERALRNEGEQANWSKIYNVHVKISDRQNLIEPLLPLQTSEAYEASFKFINIDELRKESKKNTADFYYQSALQLIDESRRSGDKKSAKEAYDYLLKIDGLFNQYKDKEQLKKVAYNLGLQHYLVRISNKTRSIIPEHVEREVLSFSLDHLNKNYKSFDVIPEEGTFYDYYIEIDLNQLEFSPEREKTRVYDDQHEEESEETVKDSKGRPVKDSLGKVIKEKVITKYISTVEEVTQLKTVQLGGRIEYINGRSGDVEFSKPLQVEGIFENKFARLIKGDRDHVSDDCRTKLKGRALPFPSNEELLLDASEKMKKLVSKIIDQQEK